MADVTILSQIDKIRDFERGYWASQIINTGFRVGILHALSESLEGATVHDLAVRLMLYEPYLRIWCQSAYHFEILDCDEWGRFKLQPFLSEVLGLDVFMTQVGDNRNVRDPQPQGNDSRIIDYMRTGRVIHPVKNSAPFFVSDRAMKSMTTIFTSMIFPGKDNIKLRLEKGCEFLDIGCGSGNLIIDFAHIFKKSIFFGIDPDAYGIEKAQRSISQFSLEERVSVQNLGGEELDEQEVFQMISLVFTLHEILPEARNEVLSKAYQALKKGGLLLIVDYPYPGKLDDFRTPRYNYGIIEQYFEGVRGVLHISQEEQDELLSNAGFECIERMPVGDKGMLEFITATK